MSTFRKSAAGLVLALVVGLIAAQNAPRLLQDDVVASSATEAVVAPLTASESLIREHRLTDGVVVTTTTTTTTTQPPTTTTTAPPPPTTQPPAPPTTQAPAPAPPAPAPAYTGSYREQFPQVPDLMWAIAGCESYGRPDAGPDWTAANPGSSARGAWQDLKSTWNGYAGYASADLAPPHVQVEFNMNLYHSSGTRPWNASKHCWG